MTFHELTYPEYDTDTLAARRNPVWSDPKWNIPSIVCPVCTVWGSGERLRMSEEAIPKDGTFDRIQYIELEEWHRRAPRWAELLGVPLEKITPAAQLGPPRGIVRGTGVLDVVHPFPGQVFVKQAVVDALREGGATGVEYWPVVLRIGKKERVPSELPELWELYVTGSASREGIRDEKLEQCEVCGRISTPDPRRIKIDETTWDGSDFVNPDGNPNRIFVTEKIKEMFDAHAFKNVRFIPC